MIQYFTSLSQFIHVCSLSHVISSHHVASHAAFSFSPEFFLFLISLLTFFSSTSLSFSPLSRFQSSGHLHLSLFLSFFLSLSFSLSFLSCVVEVEPYVGTPRRRALYLCPCCAPKGNVIPVMFAAGQLCFHNNMASGVTLTTHWTCGVLLLPFNYKVYSSPLPMCVQA